VVSVHTKKLALKIFHECIQKKHSECPGHREHPTLGAEQCTCACHLQKKFGDKKEEKGK
jgi:hypothetical protein